MITVYPVLRQRMTEHGVSCGELATIAGITVFEVYLRLWGLKRWKLPESVRVCCFFRTPDVEHLFVRNRIK